MERDSINRTPLIPIPRWTCVRKPEGHILNAADIRKKYVPAYIRALVRGGHIKEEDIRYQLAIMRCPYKIFYRRDGAIPPIGHSNDEITRIPCMYFVVVFYRYY